MLKCINHLKDYWKEKYCTAKGTYDIYILFFEQSFNISKTGGLISFITPNKYLSSPYGAALRELIEKNYQLSKVLDLSRVKVFNDPSVYPMITIIKNEKSTREYSIITEKIYSPNLDDKKSFTISSKNLKVLPDYIWGILLSDNIRIIQKIFEKSKSLEETSTVRATSTAAEADEYSKYINEKEKGLPIINTGTIDRYCVSYGVTDFMNKGTKLKRPSLDISKVSKDRRNLYNTPKIIVAKLALKIEAFLDAEGKYASINTNCISNPKEGISLKFLCGILNSKLMSFVYSEVFSGLKMSGGYFQFQAPQLRVLPIYLPKNNELNKIEVLIDQMLLLQKKYHDQKITGNEKERLKQQIDNVDYEIDQEVYKFYGITTEEQKIIEESLK